MKVVNGVMITMDVLVSVITDMIFMILTIAINQSLIVKNKKLTYALNVMNQNIGKAITGNSVLSVTKTVKFVIKTLFNATPVETVFM